MNIEPTTWEMLQEVTQNLGYPHHQRIHGDLVRIQQLNPAVCPFIASGPEIPHLILVKGPLYPNERLNGPMIEFCVVFPPTYPEAYPVITIEAPPPPYVIKNHPNVGQDGQCFLSAVSRWGPGHDDVAAAIRELGDALRNYPFLQQNTPAHAQQQYQQQQQQQQQQRYNAAPAQHQAPQQSVGQKVNQMLMPKSGVERLLVGAAVMSATVSAKTSYMVGKTVVNAMVGGSGGGGTSSREAQVNAYQEQQRVAAADADAAFIQVLEGRPMGQGTQIAFPPHGGLPAVVCSEHPTVPLRLTVAAPPPLPPCQEPTPDDMHQLTLQQQEAKRQQDAAREAAQPKPKGAFGIGMKALGIGAKAVGKLATATRDSVEDKVREREHNNDQALFETEFPMEAQKEQLAAVYQCKCMLGDGTGHAGNLFITNHQILWAMDIAKFTEKHPDQPPPAAIKVNTPLTYIVSILRSNVANSDWLCICTGDGGMRPFYSFSTGMAGKVGSVASASLAGKPIDRAYNWLDHRWRAATPVPSPQYAYGRPVQVRPY